MYQCSECGLGVIVTPEKNIKACDCEAPITCDMSATVEGRGGVAA